MIATFIGHRKVVINGKLLKSINQTVQMLIDNGYNIFLFGSRSQFNDVCLEIVNNFKKNYKNIKTVYVRAEYNYVDESYKNYLTSFYNETYYPLEI